MAKRNEKGSLLLLVALAAVIVLLATQVKPAVASVYTSAMETAVRGVVQSNKAVAPGLVRLLFHDCFVRGCDASVLLVSTPTNSAGATEKDSPANGGLRGLDLIQKIRDAIFTGAGENVSCADAIVFGAREATFVLSNGKMAYSIDGPGRNDSVTSSIQDPLTFLPGPTDAFTKLQASFVTKGFGVTELVALSGAHSIGVCHLGSFQDRLTAPISEIDSKYQAVIKKESDTNQGGAFKNNLRDMGDAAVKSSGFKNNGAAVKVNMTAVDVLDSSYYSFNLQNMVRFKSDRELNQDSTLKASDLLKAYQMNSTKWETDFKAAMTRLSNELKSEGPLFEVGFRTDCTRTNYDSY
ncbi:unnamed protein product [Alopecurus aequalis]